MLLRIHPHIRLAAIVIASMAAGSIMTGTALAGQPHMLNALALLQRAEGQLQVALPDHGGYRDQAIGLVQQAIDAVNNGIAAAR